MLNTKIKQMQKAITMSNFYKRRNKQIMTYIINLKGNENGNKFSPTPTLLSPRYSWQHKHEDNVLC